MHSGNALVIVLISLLVVSLLVSSALFVTAGKRDVSSSYKGYSSVYDMAVAGNEHALAIFNAAVDSAVDYTDEPERREMIAELFIEALKADGFNDSAGGLRRSWTVSITADITESFTGVTTVTRNATNFQISSESKKTTRGVTSYPTTVCLNIKWTNSFDGSELPVLKSQRIA
jgi:hypothetical protein